MSLELRKTISKVIASHEKDLSMRIEGFAMFVPEKSVYFVCAHGKRGCSFIYAVDVLARKVVGKQVLVSSSSIH